jgi:hypothetical protein
VRSESGSMVGSYCSLLRYKPPHVGISKDTATKRSPMPEVGQMEMGSFHLLSEHSRKLHSQDSALRYQTLLRVSNF